MVPDLITLKDGPVYETTLEEMIKVTELLRSMNGTFHRYEAVVLKHIVDWAHPPHSQNLQKLSHFLTCQEGAAYLPVQLTVQESKKHLTYPSNAESKKVRPSVQDATRPRRTSRWIRTCTHRCVFLRT